MAAPDDPLPPWRLGTPDDSLRRFAALLGSFELQESPGEARNSAQCALAPNHDALRKLIIAEELDWDSAGSPLSFPSLSLIEDDHHAVEEQDKSKAYAKAALNLAKPLTFACFASPQMSTQSSVEISYDKSVSLDTEHVAADRGANGLHDVTEAPRAMLKNLSASFCLLVDARLRAYVTFLARHGLELAESPEVPEENRTEAIRAVERKLASLLDIGSRISVCNMVTNFQPKQKLGMTRCVGDDNDEIMMPVSMSAVLDVTIPNIHSGQKSLCATLQAPGVISGTCAQGSSLLKSVQMEIETSRLMSGMIEKAAKVCSIALEHVNEAIPNHVQLPHPRATTSWALPRKKRPRCKFCDEAAHQKEQSLPVVSPDHCGLHPPTGPTPLTLDDHSDGPELSPELSPESCACIVDYCFGEIEGTLMVPTLKKGRVDAL